MDIPLVADITKQISKDYGVLIEEGADQGVALRFAHGINRLDRANSRLLQRDVHRKRKRHRQACKHQRFASRKERRRASSVGQGLPVHRHS